MSTIVLNMHESVEKDVTRRQRIGEPSELMTSSTTSFPLPASSLIAPSLKGLGENNPTAGSSAMVNLFANKSIWGDGGLSSGFGDRRTGSSTTGVQRTGSSLLLNDSISDGWNRSSTLSRPVQGSRILGSSRRPESAQFAGIQKMSESNHMSTSSSTAGPFPVTAISLNAAASHVHKPSFSANFTNPAPFEPSELPPAVYPRFERPAVPQFGSIGPETSQVSNGVGSQHGHTALSPNDDHRSFVAPNFNVQQSVPASRDNSLPTSRHGDENPLDHTFSSRQAQENYLQHNGFQSYMGYQNTPDNLQRASLQFGQMSLHDGRPSPTFSTTHAASEFSNGHDSSMSDKFSFAHASRRNSRQIDSRQSFVDSGFGSQGFPGHSYAADNFQGQSVSRARTDLAFSTRDFDSRPQSMHSSDSRRDSAQGRDMQYLNGYMYNYALGHLDQRLRHYEHQMYSDPRMAQIISQNSRGPMNPYFMGALQVPMPGGLNPYMQTGAMMHVDQHGSRQLPEGAVYKSAFLEEFKNKHRSNKAYELKNIFGHIVEFSGDQHGSRFIQQKLETANSDEKAQVFREVLGECNQLMTDVFGNYVIQKMFEHGDQSQKRALAFSMKGRVLSLSVQMYGCRVVQKALEHILTAEQAVLIGELKDEIMRCVKDQNGNHVIQQAIERCPHQIISYVFESFKEQVLHLSVHSYGCRVIQRCLEYCGPVGKAAIMAELHTGMERLVGDQYGNYVVQHVVQHGSDDDRKAVLKIVSGSIEDFSKHKFASNVVEKCLNYGEDNFKKLVLEAFIAGHKRSPETAILSLIKDSYGNYVIQTLCEVLKPRDYHRFLEYLQPEMFKARRAGSAKQVVSIEKKMQTRTATENLRAPHAHTTYASRAGSADRAPPTPPLTAESRSEHTSSRASMNGETPQSTTLCC